VCVCVPNSVSVSQSVVLCISEINNNGR